MSTVLTLSLAGFIVLVGAIIQGSAGLGMNLIGAPLLALLDPVFVPVSLLISSLLLSVLAMRREFDHVDWRGTGWAMAGRAPSTVLGVLVVAMLPPETFAVVVGGFVLVCVLLSVVSWRPRPTTAALVGAGFLGGILGTSSSIGAPPMALLYQHSDGARIRATLAAYMLFGSALSLVGLGIGGQIGPPQLLGSAVLLPFMAAGFVLSSRVRWLLDRGWMRPCVLVLSGGSALVLIISGLA